ncbi:MAG TPA: hypothetical protein VID48_07635 [Solirubrobacteraceae bacterium]|jgi:hypothetical protein
MPTLLIDKPALHTSAGLPAGPDQGVIEEARRRQRTRRIRIVVSALLATALIGVIVWALSGGASQASRGYAGVEDRAGAVEVSDTHTPGFNVRLVPMLVVGQAGWCVVVEENRVTGGSACGGVPTPSRPFLQVYGWGEGGSHVWTTVAVAIPQIATILVNGKHRVSTETLPALPYGLRAARIVTSIKRPAGILPAHRLSSIPSDPTLVALDAQGRPVAQRQTNTPLQGTVHSWRYPNRAPRGSCQLRARAIPGLSVQGGEVASAIRPFPGLLVGHAFLLCAATVYHLRHMPLRAMIVLDAAHPRARPAALPDFKPVPRAPGFFSEGGLAARRSGNAWLIVAQGSSLAQRMRLLRHLTPTVEL